MTTKQFSKKAIATLERGKLIRMLKLEKYKNNLRKKKQNNE